MKILKIPVWWTAQEAEGILLFLDELRSVIGHTYAKDFQQMHMAQEQDQPLQENDWNDEIPF